MHPRIEYDVNGVPWSTQFEDVYHSIHGGIEQARHVFIAGNQLPDRWASFHLSQKNKPKAELKDKPFVIFETGFGLGVNFFATLLEFYLLHLKASNLPILNFISVEKYLPSSEDIQKNWLQMVEAIEEVHVKNFAKNVLEDLLVQWPSAPGDYRINLFLENIQLRLIVEDVEIALDQLLYTPRTSGGILDAVYLDGFSPSKNPEMWTKTVFEKIARLCHSKSTLSTWAVSGGVKRGLVEAGFKILKKPGFSAKREMLTATL